jgi:signal transduction histidine kinase/CheY-like chemotaxis protein
VVRSRQSASELRRAQLELALRSARLIVYTWDMATDLVELSQEDRDYIGLPPGPLTAAMTFGMMHPDDVAPSLERVERTRSGEPDVPSEFRLPDGNGGWRWWVGRATRFGTGDLPIMIGVCYDDTQRRAHEAALAESEQRARQAAEEKAQFLATISHEIRTPMNGVVGMIELLAHTRLDGEQRRMVDTCRDSALVLLSLLNDVLDFSKIEAGKLDLEATRLSPRRLAEQVGVALGAQAAPRGIDVDVSVDADVPRRVVGDLVRLRQVLANLGGNAVKFTEHGRVALRVSMDARDETHAHVRFDVEDTGIGIPGHVVPTLFQPFRQADASTTRRFGGTGLGLSIVGHLVELMDGRVECESREGEGSRFSVVVPLRHVDDPEPETAPAPATHAIAFAEDARRRALLRDMLMELRADVATAADEEELAACLAECPRDTPRVLVVDKRTALAGRLLAGIDTHFDDVPLVLVRGLDGASAGAAPRIVQVEGNPLTRANLLQGIDQALGREMPASRAPAPIAPPELAPDIAAQLGRLVLLADDHPVNRDVIVQQLRQLGYGCEAVEDGEQAWSRLQADRARYCLLLTDCHMPVLDGFALTARIRAAERECAWRPLPIAAITASASQGEGEKCLAAGMDDFLAKPVQMDDLRAMLARTLPPIEGFDALARLVQGDRDRLRRILGSYLQDTRGDLDRWRMAEAAGDRDALERLSHKLKSGFVQVGARDAAQAMEAVERDAPDLRVTAAAFAGGAARARGRMEAIVVDIERALGGLSSPA